uniref:Uncharacterized protein n=1 Tax=Rhizophora mucronata TaxID=61149 RepID=A0A2P2MY85_RHIMU
MTRQVKYNHDTYVLFCKRHMIIRFPADNEAMAVGARSLHLTLGLPLGKPGAPFVAKASPSSCLLECF